MKIGLISDIHASPEPLEEALAIFRQEQTDQIWCAGDIVGYGQQAQKTIQLLQENNCQVIQGNHESWYQVKHHADADPSVLAYLNDLPLVKQLNYESQLIYMVHASPPEHMTGGIRLRDRAGQLDAQQMAHWTTMLKPFDYDVLIVGHTHQVFAEKLGNMLVINPGSTHFNHCCGVLSLPDLTVKWFALSGRSIAYSWNWGDTLSA